MVSQLGEFLRQRREALGITLEELQTRTKIRIKYLEAIEAGDFEVIPGEVYLRGFIRSVANELGIDQQEAMQVYYQEDEPVSEPAVATPTAPKAAEPARVAPVVEPEPTRQVASPLPRSTQLSRARKKPANVAPRLLWLLLLVGVVVAGVYLWDKLSGQQPLVEDPNLLPPADEQGKEPEPAPPTVKVVLQNPGDAKPMYFVQPGPLEVVLTAEGDKCWVGAKADSSAQQATLDPKGQTPSLTLQAQNEITVRIGNPAALRLTINGLDQGIIGGTKAIDLTVKLQPNP